MIDHLDVFAHVTSACAVRESCLLYDAVVCTRCSWHVLDDRACDISLSHNIEAIITVHCACINIYPSRTLDVGGWSGWCLSVPSNEQNGHFLDRH
jgi:hypothetical protein